MTFNDIIGQDEVKQRLTAEFNSNHLPHALMLYGPEGNGAFQLALALARMLLGQQGAVQGMMVDQLQHPDLHFSFPIYKKDSGKPAPCDLFLKQWRELLLRTPYFSYSEWMDAIGAENQQLQIYESESDSLAQKLSLRANQGGYRVVIIWLPEKMNTICANKLLKLLEEPPSQTVFLMVSQHPEQLLTTIRSRCQSISVPPLTETDIEQYLVRHAGIDPQMAAITAHTSSGNICNAIHAITDDSEQQQFFDLFVSLMRLSYMRRVKEMKQWSEEVASLGRERQKRLLAYCQHMIRENFIYNFHTPQLNYMAAAESQFAVKFAPFINERNVIGIMDELNLAQRDIEQNGSARIVFFDFALKMIVLIKNR
ncbi:MAG: DNA polymerase III subunit delta [Prevotellaceae bacterium]|nr:DNA polymerase III subunit delta [Candidatus Colivivens caballi]